MDKIPTLYAIQPNDYKAAKDEGRVVVERRRDAYVAIFTGKGGEKEEFAIDLDHQRSLIPVMEDLVQRSKATLANLDELIGDLEAIPEPKGKVVP